MDIGTYVVDRWARVPPALEAFYRTCVVVATVALIGSTGAGFWAAGAALSGGAAPPSLGVIAVYGYWFGVGALLATIASGVPVHRRRRLRRAAEAAAATVGASTVAAWSEAAPGRRDLRLRLRAATRPADGSA